MNRFKMHDRIFVNIYLDGTKKIFSNLPDAIKDSEINHALETIETELIYEINEGTYIALSSHAESRRLDILNGTALKKLHAIATRQ